MAANPIAATTMTVALPAGAGVAESDVDLEKTRLMFQNTGMAQTIVAINGGVVVFVLGGWQPPLWAVLWWLAVMAVAIVRYGLARSFLAGTHGPAEAALRRQRAVAWTFAAGLLWGVGSAAMMVADPESTRLFVAMVAAGMVGGAVPILSAVRLAFPAYAVPSMLSILITALLDAHGTRDWMLGLVTALYLLAVLRSARHFHATLDRSIRLALHMRHVAEQLEQARELEREVHREQRQFVATVSHELRTPLAVIDATTQNLITLNGDQLDVAVRGRLEKIQLAVDRLTAIVEECLTPERLSVLEGKPNLKTVPLLDLLADAAATARMYSESHRLCIECDAATTAYCDPELFRLVLRTLADNAVKYTPSGSCITLRADSGNEGTHIDVTDDGPGITADELPHVFEKYFRGRTAVSHPGTGLGLPLARHVVEQIGGTIRVSSSANSGTTFSIHLPAAAGA